MARKMRDSGVAVGKNFHAEAQRGRGAEKMKPSGIPWIGEIPEGWEVGRVKNSFYHTKEVVKERAAEFDRLALTLQGVIKRPKEDTNGLQPKEFEGYQILRKNELVFKLIDLQNISTSRVGRSSYDGIVSPAYIILHSRDNSCTAFACYYFMSMWMHNIFQTLGGDAVRSCLNASDLLNVPLPLPPIAEQKAIADYLDEKCAAIDGAVGELKRGIEDCKAWKKAIIFEAVTGKRQIGFSAEKQRGRVAERPMRDTGIPWIGEVPEGCEVMKGKYLFSARSGDAIRNEILADNGTYPVYGGGEVIGFADNWNCDANTVLIGRVGARCGCVTLLRNQAWATDNALIISTNKCVRYITYLLIGANLNQFNSSNAQPLITAGKIKNLPFPFVCDLREQQAIADYLDEKCAAIDALVAEKEKLIADLETYKKSLIFELVTGKREVA